MINACNASLRNDKFSAMATRTRKQYLNDLAESHVTAINIEQANTSGRVGMVYLHDIVYIMYNIYMCIKIDCPSIHTCPLLKVCGNDFSRS